MKREFLKDLGIESEAIDKIMAENGKDIEKAKGNADQQTTKVKELEAEVESLKGNIADRDKQLEDLKKEAGDNETLKSQIEKLTKDNKDAAAKHEAEMEAVKKNHAIEAELMKARAKAIKAVSSYIDTEKVTIDSKGNLVGLEEQIKALKESDETKFLFDSGAPQLKGAIPGQPGDPEGGQQYTKKQILAMPYKMQQDIYNKDPEAYRAIMDQ